MSAGGHLFLIKGPLSISLGLLVAFLDCFGSLSSLDDPFRLPILEELCFILIHQRILKFTRFLLIFTHIFKLNLLFIDLIIGLIFHSLYDLKE